MYSPLMEEAIQLATKMIQDGKVEKLKGILLRFDRRRVVELSDAQLPEFIDIVRPRINPHFPGSVDV